MCNGSSGVGDSGGGTALASTRLTPLRNPVGGAIPASTLSGGVFNPADQTNASLLQSPPEDIESLLAFIGNGIPEM
jgi:hypothetical protein